MSLPRDASFRIESRTEHDTLVLHLLGVIDENADLTAMAEAQAPKIRLELAGVHRINSFGVRAWMDAMRQISKDSHLVLARCAPPVIDQCNMVVDFHGHGTIESFYAPLICEACQEQTQRLYQTDDCLTDDGALRVPPCPHCQQPMEIDDLEEQYLIFLRGV